MIQLSVAIVVVGSILGTLGASSATPLPEKPTESILTSPGVVPREFKFKIESRPVEIDPVEHAEKLRYEADRLELRDRLPNPLPDDFPAMVGTSDSGRAADVIDYLPPESPNLWGDIDMPVEPRTNFLGVTLLGFGVWAIYRGWLLGKLRAES